MSYNYGDIVVVRFPFVLRNGSEIQKGRPALVISDDKVERRYNDVILAAITSQVPDDIMELELVVGPEKETGLQKKSLVRLDFIMTIPKALISRKIGQLPDNMLKQAEKRIKKAFAMKEN
ncbi:MAG: type II toxin-antitoxin system PemK/MazF family toxin [Desulfatiglandales bacterium]